MRWRWLAAGILGACASAGDGTPIALPGADAGIGFDDLRWSRDLRRVIVPGGRAGKVYLVDPDTGAVAAYGGFSTLASYEGGHDDGATSADVARGLLFVTDRTTRLLHVLDAKTGARLASAALSAGPDYVRWVGATGELWVTEPSGSQLEIFTLDGTTPRSVAILPVDNGPESLVIDQTRERAYTHHWQERTMAIDVRTRQIVGDWPNGCAASRGIELEPEHGWIFAACNEGTLTVLDPSNGGRILDALASGGAYDVMGYAPSSRHAFLAGHACGCLSVIGVAPNGKLDFLGRFDAPSATHCAVADDRGHAYACAPSSGSLERFDDSFPTRRP